MYAQLQNVPIAPANISPWPPHRRGLPFSVTLATKIKNQIYLENLLIKPNSLLLSPDLKSNYSNKLRRLILSDW